MHITLVTHYEESRDKAACWVTPRSSTPYEYNYTRRRDIVTCLNCQAALARQESQ
jgi:hypothetical protein